MWTSRPPSGLLSDSSSRPRHGRRRRSVDEGCQRLKLHTWMWMESSESGDGPRRTTAIVEEEQEEQEEKETEETEKEMVVKMASRQPVR